jgi:hypothetical protein
MEVTNIHNANQIVVEWRDYLDMAKSAKMELTQSLIYAPNDIRKAHDAVLKLVGSVEIARTAEKYREKFPKCETVMEEIRGLFAYKGKEYQVIEPTCIEDIIKEGQTLGHCIDRTEIYYDQIERKESYILFLRRAAEPDKPWYTLEVEHGGVIRQKRTVGNKQLKDLKKAMPFLKKWQKIVRKRMSNEDMQLAKQAEELREQNFKKLTESKTKVRNGPMSGQLLVEILKADLMEVTI